MSVNKRHRWDEKVVFLLKTERSCKNGCGITMVTHHECEGGRDLYWTDFWRDGAKIECEGTPVCEAVMERAGT